MAAPTINVNLTTIDEAENDPAGWEKVGAGGQITGDGDIYIQDGGGTTNSEVTTIGASANILIMYDNGATITFGTQDHLYAWINFTAPAKVNSTALGGQRIAFGDGSTTIGNMAQYYVGGNEAEYIPGGWRCVVASPSVTPQAGSAAAPYQSFGAGGFGAENVGKDNFFIDVIRYGRGLQTVDGDSTNPGTMKSFTDVNDAIANQYGVVREQGSGASVQGEVSIGHTDATSTDTYFSDSNYAIFVPNKNPLSGSSSYATLDTFTGVRVLGSATTAIFSNFSFSSNDAYDKGYFSCQTSYPFTYSAAVAPLDVDLDGCTFNNWGQTQLSPGTTATNTTWIGCEPITLNSGTLDNCTVETGVGGTYVFAGTTPDNISNTSFIGGGTGGGHGFEVTAGGTYSFVGNNFFDFGANGTDDAAVHINGTGIAVTFNISGGGDGSFTYKLTGVGATVDFVSSVTVNVTGLPVAPTGNATEIEVLGAGTTNQIGVRTENHRTSTYTFSLSSGESFDLRILNLDYVPLFVSNQTASTDPTNVPVDLKLDRVYDDDTPPTGE